MGTVPKANLAVFIVDLHHILRSRGGNVIHNGPLLVVHIDMDAVSLDHLGLVLVLGHIVGIAHVFDLIGRSVAVMGGLGLVVGGVPVVKLRHLLIGEGAHSPLRIHFGVSIVAARPGVGVILHPVAPSLIHLIADFELGHTVGLGVPVVRPYCCPVNPAVGILPHLTV